jgi:hypothetical protein
MKVGETGEADDNVAGVVVEGGILRVGVDEPDVFLPVWVR